MALRPFATSSPALLNADLLFLDAAEAALSYPPPVWRRALTSWALAVRSAGLTSWRASVLPAPWNALASDVAAAACCCGVFAALSFAWPDLSALSSAPSVLLRAPAYFSLGPTGNGLPALSVERVGDLVAGRRERVGVGLGRQAGDRRHARRRRRRVDRHRAVEAVRLERVVAQGLDVAAADLDRAAGLRHLADRLHERLREQRRVVGRLLDEADDDGQAAVLAAGSGGLRVRQREARDVGRGAELLPVRRHLDRRAGGGGRAGELARVGDRLLAAAAGAADEEAEQDRDHRAGGERDRERLARAASRPGGPASARGLGLGLGGAAGLAALGSRGLRSLGLRSFFGLAVGLRLAAQRLGHDRRVRVELVRGGRRGLGRERLRRGSGGAGGGGRLGRGLRDRRRGRRRRRGLGDGLGLGRSDGLRRGRLRGRRLGRRATGPPAPPCPGPPSGGRAGGGAM